MKQFEKIHYLKYSIFHPFDAFYEIRFRGKGSGVLAACMIVLYGILACVDYQYMGFVMNDHAINSMNSISIFLSSSLAFVLFIVSNWSVTTLLNGKGNLAGILTVTGYSLVPLLIATAIKVFISNFIIEEEIMILQVIMGISIVWFLFMMIAGLCVIHEYTFGKNLISIFLTFVAAAVILFLGILFFTLIEQMVSFFVSVGEEFFRRL